MHRIKHFKNLKVVTANKKKDAYCQSGHLGCNFELGKSPGCVELCFRAEI